MPHTAKVSGNSVIFSWEDGSASPVSLFWLRDHCRCAQCLHPETQQRLADTFTIPGAIAGGLAVRRLDVAANAPEFEIEWQDGHVSAFDAGWLRDTLGRQTAPAPARIFWDDARISAEVPKVSYEAVMAGDDAGLTEWLEKIERYGFAFVEGTPATPEATQAVAKRAAYIRESIFGGYYDFTANMEHKDTAYTSMAIGPHTDGTYSFDAPGYQMFHCLGLDAVGGDSVLVDGFRIAEIMAAETPELYRVLTEVEVTGQYIDHEKGIHLMAKRPLLRLDSSGKLVQVSFNNHDRAPMHLPEAALNLFYRAYGEFARLANDRSLQYRRLLVPGALVLFDNWRLLHARDAYQGYRRLAGAYLNKEDVESRLRVLRMKAGARAVAA